MCDTGLVIPDIEDSFEKQSRYPSVVERYYTPYYYTNENEEHPEHHCVLVHSNRICLITLALSHPIVKNQKVIKHLDFQVSNKLDRLDNKVQGKGKKGAQHILPHAVLCFAECTDGSKYSIFGCIKGKLIEINENLLTCPQLLVEKPTSEGFIAIILPNLKDVEDQKKHLMSVSQYSSLGLL